MGGGNNNTASNYADVALGEDATASGSNSTVSGGYLNVASAAVATVVGGSYNTANSAGSTVVGNRGTSRSIAGNVVFAAHDDSLFSSTQGGAQSGMLIIGVQTTDATATILRSRSTAADTTNQLILANNSAYYFRGSIVAGVTGAGNAAMWSFEGGMERGANAASTVLMNSVINLVAQDTGASAWVVALSADTTNGGLAVTVTGQASTTIRWVCKIETTEMTF